MKLDYLDDITDSGKYPLADPDRLLRLYDFDAFELSKMRHLIKRSLIDRQGQLIISNLDFVLPVNCTLTFLVSERDSGIKLQAKDDRNFLGQFSMNTYVKMLEIIDLLEDGYNWLYDPCSEDEIHLLLSKDGGW
jgi:hypothetical protein